MRKAVSLVQIEKEIESLALDEQLRLVEFLIHHLRKGDLAPQKARNWDKLYGLGRGLWKGEDAQEYVNRLREDRV